MRGYRLNRGIRSLNSISELDPEVESETRSVKKYKFNLKSPQGDIHYSQPSSLDYNLFLCRVFGLLLETGEVDSSLRAFLQKAIYKYAVGKPIKNHFVEDPFSEDSFPSWEISKPHQDISEILEEGQACEEATNFLKNLTCSKEYNITVLSIPPQKDDIIQALIRKSTDLPPFDVYSITYEQKVLKLPSKEARNLYTELRTAGAIISIHPARRRKNLALSTEEKKKLIGKASVSRVLQPTKMVEQNYSKYKTPKDRSWLDIHIDELNNSKDTMAD